MRERGQQLPTVRTCTAVHQYEYTESRTGEVLVCISKDDGTLPALAMMLTGGGRRAPVPPSWISSPFFMMRHLGNSEPPCCCGSFPRGVFP
jgi:hypothetical protein